MVKQAIVEGDLPGLGMAMAIDKAQHRVDKETNLILIQVLLHHYESEPIEAFSLVSCHPIVASGQQAFSLNRQDENPQTPFLLKPDA